MENEELNETYFSSFFRSTSKSDIQFDPSMNSSNFDTPLTNSPILSKKTDQPHMNMELLNESDFFQYKPSVNLNIEIEELMIDTSSKLKQIENKTKGLSTKKKSNQILFNQLPFLSSFKPKYAKRETIDKRILRSFRKYLYELSKKTNIIPSERESCFYIRFINMELFPPFKYIDPFTLETICFKSYNSNYLLWFFSKPKIKEYYLQFTYEQSPICEISQYYELNDFDRNQLSNYVNNLPFIFDNSLVSKIAGKEGYKCGHLYRKKTQRENIRNLLSKRSEVLSYQKDSTLNDMNGMLCVQEINENEDDDVCNNMNNKHRENDSAATKTSWGDDI
jgi:hypothetical protein